MSDADKDPRDLRDILDHRRVWRRISAVLPANTYRITPHARMRRATGKLDPCRREIIRSVVLGNIDVQGI